jgi:hypothetical protein
MTKVIKKTPYFILTPVIIAFVIAAALLVGPGQTASLITPAPITGYAWSDPVGWIDLNCANLSVCSTNNFGLSIDSSGVISGTAWSDNVGWISANMSDLTGCPFAPCSATIVSGALVGWLKVIAGGSANSGGWDGWISLNGSNYGTVLSNGVFSGYAWGGGIDIGWVDLSLATTVGCDAAYYCVGNEQWHRDAQCSEQFVMTCSAGCSGSACLPVSDPVMTFTVSPNMVNLGGTTNLTWSATNVKSCTVTSTSGQTFPSCTSSNCAIAQYATSNPIASATTFTLSCISLDDKNYSISKTVSVIPQWGEV